MAVNTSCCGFLCYDTVHSGQHAPHFQTDNHIPQVPQMFFSETLVPTYQAPRFHNPENHNTNTLLFCNLSVLNYIFCLLLLRVCDLSPYYLKETSPGEATCWHGITPEN